MAEKIGQFSPWGLKPLQRFVVNELDARAKEYGMNVAETLVSSDIPSANDRPHAGPRTAWVRACSNGVGEQNKHSVKQPGFVMGTASSSFDDAYGFGESKESIKGGKRSIIGYDAEGYPHEIDNADTQTFPHRPPPGIVSVESEFNGAGSSMTGLSRKATIKWKCSTLEQLEYMTPYFLTPKISVVLEWGWSDYDPLSLNDLGSKNIGRAADPSKEDIGEGLIGAFTNSSLIQDDISVSNGNYDCQIGIIVDYGYTLNATDGFDCYTVIQNPQFLADGLPLNASTSIVSKEETEKKMMTFKTFVEKHLDNIGNSGKTKVDFSADPTLQKIFNKKKYFSTSEFENITSEKVEGKWVRMDLFVEIFNKFLSPQWNTATGLPVKLFQIDIADCVISAHPLLKSVDQDVLIPNAYAPKLISEVSYPSQSLSQEALSAGSDVASTIGNVLRLFTPVTGVANIASAVGTKSIQSSPAPLVIASAGLGGEKYSQIANTEAAALYKTDKLSAGLSKLGLSKEYDDLDALLNKYTEQDKDDLDEIDKKSVRKTNFPRLETKHGTPDGIYESGYYGYLKDLFISVKLIKEALVQNDTSQKFIQFILDRISVAGSDLWSFKIANDPNSVSPIKIIDLNFCQYGQKSDVVPVFLLGDSNHACFTEFKMNVKMTGEMAMQAIFGQTANKNSKTPNTSVDMKPVLFVHEDRLFQGDAAIDIKQPDITSLRMGGRDRESLNGFFAIKLKKSASKATTHILTERDAGFMKEIVRTRLDDPSRPTLGNMIMPGTEMTLTCLGIGGFRFLDLFALKGVPKPYRFDNAVWQVDGVRQSISKNYWTTEITAKVRPLTIIQQKK